MEGTWKYTVGLKPSVLPRLCLMKGIHVTVAIKKSKNGLKNTQRTKENARGEFTRVT